MQEWLNFGLNAALSLGTCFCFHYLASGAIDRFCQRVEEAAVLYMRRGL